MKKIFIKAVTSFDHSHWHNGGEIEIGFYARSLHKAAKSLIASLDLEPNPNGAWDACPIVLLYRQSVELHLKALVDKGVNFMRSPTDPLTLHKTHSLRWLSQIVCQIIRAVKWESEFQCNDVASLADFSALVNELEELDPVTCLVYAVSRNGSVPHQLQPPHVVQFAKKLDGLLDLLDATASALGAAWHHLAPGEEDFPAMDDTKPTIH